MQRQAPEAGENETKMTKEVMELNRGKVCCTPPREKFHTAECFGVAWKGGQD